MTARWEIVIAVVAYMAILAAISYVVRRSSRTAEGYSSGGKAFPAALIGFLLMSEFIGTSATLGTAQEAYEVGISAAWNVIALAVGFVLYALLLARKYKELGQNTISGVLATAYGDGVRTATSVIMTCALLIVTVTIYASGGAMLATLLGIDRTLAIVVVGLLATIYVMVGGMRSVVYTNVLHASMKLLAVALLAAIGLDRVGGPGALRDALPAASFALDGVGLEQIFAWMIAGIGAVFATQYVVQAVITVRGPDQARQAAFYSALMLIPFGILAALAGMVSAVLYPGIDSIDALPRLAVDIDPLATALVMCGLAGTVLGSIAALTIGSATLITKDFLSPWLNPAGDDRKDVLYLRASTFAAGVIPIALALYASDLLEISFLAKSLRAALAVLIVMMFYAPGYGSPRAAAISIGGALVATIGWFLAGDPYGIDNAYVAIAVPIIVMSVAQLTRRKN